MRVGLAGGPPVGRGRDALPETDASADDAEDRMSRGPDAAMMTKVPVWTSRPELSSEMSPLEMELAPRFGNPGLEARNISDSRGIEGVPPGKRFLVNRVEIRRDGCDGIRPGSESNELGMPGVAAGPAEQDGLGQERLPPERHETCRVEVAGVEGPDPHVPKAPEFPCRNPGTPVHSSFVLFESQYM